MKPIFTRFGRMSLVLATALMAGTAAHAVAVRVTIENLAPAGGTLLTPTWIGFHDGTFDIYDLNSPASTALERLAEDGNNGPISADFASSGASTGNAQTTIPGFGGASAGPIDPGETASVVINVDRANRYFSFASMVLPSNDTFIANGNPLAYEIFDINGDFSSQTIQIGGSAARDAGTEVNDEIPENTAFLAQMIADTGQDENGLVSLATGFNPGGNILAAFPNGDYTADGYQFAEITVAPVPLPAPLALLLVGVAGLAGTGLRRKTRS